MPHSLKFKQLLLSFLSLMFLFAYGQRNDIHIQVVDSVTSTPLPFSNIYLKYSGVGGSTDFDGKLALKKDKIQAEDSLVISYVGYQKKQLFFKRDSLQQLIVYLTPSNKYLKEVVVDYKKPLKAEQIIKKALKNTKQNYSTSDEILNCYFRETIQENGTYIQLNEAFTDIYYTSYPQKKLDRKIWESWYNDELYTFDLEADYVFYALLKDFNTQKDRMKILASRSSENQSQYGIESALTGGPLLLTAYDKIKYQYDFLNPAILNKYHFQKEGIVNIEGSTCYALSFYPKSKDRRFILDQSRKNKSPIYIGKIYIEKKSFAVVSFEYHLAVERNFGFFANRMPLTYEVKVDYSKSDDKWRLKTIRFSETKQVGTNPNKKAILHTGQKELFILDHQKADESLFPDSLLYYSTRYTVLRYYKDYNNPAYWDTHPLPTEIQLSPQLITQLEKEQTLNEQFADRFIQKKDLPIPKAGRKVSQIRYHNTVLSNPYHWMSLAENQQALITYLQKENEYAKNALLTDQKYQRKLFEELNEFYLKDSIKQQKIKDGDFFFKKDSLNNDVLFFQMDSTQQVPVFNQSNFLEQNPNCWIKKMVPNSRKNLLYLQYEITGVLGDFVSVYPFGQEKAIDSISNVYSVEWSADSSFIYCKTNDVGRSNQLILRQLKTHSDSVMYTETDITFDVDLEKNGEKLFCTLQSKSENEIHWIDLSGHRPRLKLVQKRRDKVTYQLLAEEDKWYMLSNENAPNNKIMESSTSFPFKWETLVENDKNSFIIDFGVSQNYLFINTYENSFSKLKFIRKDSKQWSEIPLDHDLGSIELQSHSSKNDSIFFWYSSFSTPYTYYACDLEQNNHLQIEQQKVKYPYKLNMISTKRLWAKSHDGTKIPISIAQSRMVRKKHKGLILKTYGAYGAYTSPSFSAQDVVLMQEGYTIAYAHVRGEIIMGNKWYEEGKLMNKKNSFEDYIACAEFLIKKKITSPSELIAYGNSAGGLIVGWAINKRPELFSTAILDHPYLDVVGTMINDTLPLTADEYKEWGNPKEKDVFDYLYSYSPYQNIKKQDYPNLIFIASYQDYQTPIWQIAQHVTKIRENNTSNSDVILLTDMNSGHSGNHSGKEWIKLFSRIYSFTHLQLAKEE